ncbi:MAG: peptidase S10 [Cyclobacteriaceae bacterium]
MKNRLTLLLIFVSACGFAQVKSLNDAETLSVTAHKVVIGGKQISYTAHAGYMVLPDDAGKPKGKMFFMYYKKDGVTDPSTRPITFTFNGGPGSPSMWLHMGMLGPRRIAMTDFGGPTLPPYKIVDNEYSWLDVTDLIFIDPVQTGYSRAAEGVDKKEFLGYEEDIDAVGSFIHLATTRFERWNSPKFIAGESYGTIRASGLSSHLQNQYGMYLNGIVLISAVLNWETEVLLPGNDLPAITYLPTFCAIAWYHKKAGTEYSTLNPFLDEVEKFALGEYATALLKGDQLSDAERESMVSKLSSFSGLSKEYLAQTNYRINIRRFVKELLREDHKTVGRLDGRFTGSDYDAAGERYEFDPSNAAIIGPFSMAINDYIRRELKYTEDNPYYIGGKARPWNYNNVQNRFLNVAEDLRSAIHQNPYLKVHVTNGYYDLATPYFGTDYTINHMFLDKSMRGNITQSFYEAGHMMYIHKPSIIKMKKEIDDFYKVAQTQ